MKVSELLEQLKSYSPDDHLLVAYWDKEYVDTSYDSEAGITISDELWQQAIRRAEKAEFWQTCGSEEICDQVQQLLDEEIKWQQEEQQLLESEGE